MRELHYNVQKKYSRNCVGPSITTLSNQAQQQPSHHALNGGKKKSQPVQWDDSVSWESARTLLFNSLAFLRPRKFQIFQSSSVMEVSLNLPALYSGKETDGLVIFVFIFQIFWTWLHHFKMGPKIQAPTQIKTKTHATLIFRTSYLWLRLLI